MNILFFVLLYAGLFLLLLFLLKVPTKRSGQNLRTQVAVKVKMGTRLFHLAVKPLIKPVSMLIRLDPAKEAGLLQMLRRGGLDLAPREYYARAVVCAVFTLPLSLLTMILGVGQLAPVTLVFSIVVYFHCMTDLKDKLKKKKDMIEAGLPGFIRSIIYKLDQTSREADEIKVQADLIGIFADYLRVANDVFYYDVAVLITEMKSMDIQTALRNFADRVGLTEVNFLVGALIGLERGERQGDTLSALAKDMDLKAREYIKKQLAKRPGKVRMATIPLVIVAIATLLYVIVSHLFMSIGGLF